MLMFEFDFDLGVDVYEIEDVIGNDEKEYIVCEWR